MDAYQVIKFIIVIGLITGGVSHIIRKRSALDEKFREAFAMAGQLLRRSDRVYRNEEHGCRRRGKDLSRQSG